MSDVVEIPRCILAEKIENRDLSSLKSHGDIEFLFPEGTTRPCIFACQNVMNAMLEELTEMGYDPLIDYIVITGGLIILTELVAAISAKYGAFKVLIFDSKHSKYYPHTYGV